MKSFEGYLKKKLGDSYVLLAGGSHKALSDFLGSIQWDSTNNKLQYKTSNANSWSDLVIFGTNAFNSTQYLPLAGGTMTGNISIGNSTFYASGSNGNINSLALADDCILGDCNIGGHLGLKSLNTNDAGIAFYKSGGSHIGTFTATTDGYLNWNSSGVLVSNLSLTITETKTFNNGKWVIAGSESNEITTEHFSNGALYNHANTAAISNLWSITNALKFRWYNTYWLMGSIRSGSEETAGFGIALRDNTNNRQIDYFRIDSAGAYINGNTIYHTGNLNDPFLYRSSYVSDAYVNGTYSTISSGTYLHALSGSTSTLLHFLSEGSVSGLDIYCHTYEPSSGISYRKSVDKHHFASGWYKIIDDHNIGNYFKTINGQSIVGSGNITISGSGSVSNNTLGPEAYVNGTTSELPHIVWHIPNVNWGNISMNSSGEFFLRSTNSTSASYANFYANLPDYLAKSGGKLTGSLEINSTGGSWNEGIRMHVASNLWCGLIMCGSDNTGGSGSSAKTWSIHNNDGTFYISLNGSSSGTNVLTANSSSWTFSQNVYAPNFYTSSDIRYKEDISSISLETLLEFKQFILKSTKTKSFGLIALEVEKYYPELVSKDNNGFESVNYIAALCLTADLLLKKVSLLENTIKELAEKISTLERRLILNR